MGSVSPRPFSILNLFHLNPSDASEEKPRVCFPTGDHPVDSAAECLDADISPEPRQQQQQQPSTTTTRGQPDMFSRVATTGVC